MIYFNLCLYWINFYVIHIPENATQKIELKILFVLSFVIMFNGINLNSKLLKI